MFAQGDANAVLDAVLQTTSYPSVTSAMIRLGSNIGTATVVMTQISGTGYTPGGSAITFNAASGQTASNSGALSWTNTSGSSWTIEGLEIWDTAGTPLRHLFGSWTGQPITVTTGNTFAVASGAVAVSLL
jgi:hypothetical protein